MIVDATTLDVRPVADLLLASAAGEPGACDVERGAIAWSNELALHVIEFKTNGPARSVSGLGGSFQASVLEANQLLEALGARLLPGGMHPWMDPAAELRIWPHEYNDVYRAFDRIFGCRGHGWANLQSTHINLPFQGDEEFFRLHEAIRLVLPLIPALAASSPVLDGRAGLGLDNRLLAYRDNARWVPSVTDRVVPERIASVGEYRSEILEKIYADLWPLDPEGTLRHEWVNARGAIARMERGSIEIRVIDAQESPRADVAVVSAVVGAVRYLADGPLREAGPGAGAGVETTDLVSLLEETILEGENARVRAPEYRSLLGSMTKEPPTVRDVWRRLIELSSHLDPEPEQYGEVLDVILEEGPLARRILHALGKGTGEERERLRAVYGKLADCLAAGTVFRSGD
jgi:gamma-glutamyl:cysteine ligase YbdK (ATP-grasp superfamily)